MVPSGWTLENLGDICFINPKKMTKPEDGQVSFIAMNQLSEDGQLISGITKHYDEVSKGFTSFKDDDVLVAKITPCFENGKGALVRNLVNGIGFGSTEFHVLRFKKNTCPEFIYYLTRTTELRAKGEMNMQGSAGHRRVTADYFHAYKVKTPPLPEQRKIAQILGTWDKAISTTERLIDNSKQQKKALMQQLLTGTHTQRKRLLDDSGIAFKGEWEEAPLKKCVTFLNGIRKPIKKEDRANMQGNYPYYGATSVIDYVDDYLFDDELILLGEDGENILSRVLPHVFTISGKTWVNNHAHVMKANADKDTSFLCMYLENLDYKKYNSGSAQPKINKAVCEKISIRFPVLKEQKKIAAVLTNADKEIELLDQQLADLKQEKKALMQQLLTGKRRVLI